MPESLVVVEPDQAELELDEMRIRLDGDKSSTPRSWLTKLLFAPEWGRHGKPVLFLSTPESGRAQMALVKRALGDAFYYRELNTADTTGGITLTAVQRIQESHFFLGLWHPDRGKAHPLSPWMPFEYGVALSSHKPSIILQHTSLDRFTKARIDSNKARIVYGDLAEEPEKLDLLRRLCDEFVASHRRLTIV